MSGWKVFYRDDHRHDAQSTHTSKAAIVQALHLERHQHSRKYRSSKGKMVS